MSFEEQAKRAHLVEDKVAVSLLSIRPTYRQVKHNDRAKKGFDLEFERDGKDNLKIEVKEDLLFSKTGNIAVEYRSRGKDSGITTTEASHWIYVLGDEYYVIHVANLRKLLKTAKKVVGGDIVTRCTGEQQYSSELYLVKVDNFKSMCEGILPKYEDVIQEQFDKLHSVA